MSSTLKTAVTANTAGLADLTTADASDVLNPITDLLTHVKNGRASVSATDTYVKHLDDAFSFGTGLEKAILNPGGNEVIEVKSRTAIVPFWVLGSSVLQINITSIPATFEHLLLVAGLRGMAAATQETLACQFNDDGTTTNYAALTAAVQHSGSLSTSEALEGVLYGGQMANAITGGSAPAGYQGLLYMIFYEYAQVGRPRLCRWWGMTRRGNASGELTMTEGCVMWKNTVNPITWIKLHPISGLGVAAGSGYGLYEIR